MNKRGGRRGPSFVIFMLGLAIGLGLGGAVFYFLLGPGRSLLGSFADRTAPKTAKPAIPEETPRMKTQPIPPEAINQAKAAYRIDGKVAGGEFNVELIVLPDVQPVVLSASFDSPGQLPLGLRETKRSLRWEADGGQILVDQGTTATGTAWLRPPAESQMVTLRLVGEAELVYQPAGGTPQPLTVSLEKTFRVLTPVESTRMVNGWINGYQIGEYLIPTDPKVLEKFHIESDWFLRFPQRYQVPSVFYKVDAEWKDLKISPNLTLGFFATDYPWKSFGMPQYIALDLNLVRKIEDLLALMRADDLALKGFVPLYGFRPPAFNLGTIEEHPETNLKEPFSMHQYGRAVDIMIDDNGDGQLDDLNGDGVVDIHDAAVMMHYINILDRQYREAGRMDMVGGAGLYTHNDFVERVQYFGLQSPYVHLDTRGFVRQNQTLVRWPDTWPDGTAIRWSQI